MKTLPKLFAATVLTALCAATTPALAQTTAAISFTQSSPASLRLRIASGGPLAGRVQVVRLRTGQTLYSETYEAPAYGHRFDFSQTPSGRYLVWVQAGANTHRCIVQVRTRAHTSTARVARLTSRAASPSIAVVGSLPGSPVAVPTVSAVTNAAAEFEGQQLR